MNRESLLFTWSTFSFVGGYISILIRDIFPDIPAERYQKIFHPFEMIVSIRLTFVILLWSCVPYESQDDFYIKKIYFVRVTASYWRSRCFLPQNRSFVFFQNRQYALWWKSGIIIVLKCFSAKEAILWKQKRKHLFCAIWFFSPRKPCAHRMKSSVHWIKAAHTPSTRKSFVCLPSS